MRDYVDIALPFWTDHLGTSRHTSGMKKLHFGRLPSHVALRAFVYRRDCFTCQWCRVSVPAPADYDGKDNLVTGLKNKDGWDIWFVVDHIVSRRNGGSNHPENLQMLCYTCNSAKSGLIDSKAGK